MRFQVYIITATEEAAKDAFKYAKAVPSEKVAWKPLDSGRSVLDQCQEMALCPQWALEIVAQQDLPERSEETMKAIEAEKAQFTTVEACETECNRRLAALLDYYRAMPDDRLSEKKWLPFDGGRDFEMPEMMEYPRWNFNYHLGQIAYIQTLYGDSEMDRARGSGEGEVAAAVGLEPTTR